MNREVVGRARQTEHGDREVALGGEILRTVVGSGVHGIAIEGTQPERERVLAVKRGEVRAIEDVLAEIGDVQAQIEERLTAGHTPLPAEPDLPTISEWSINAHRRHWAW